MNITSMDQERIASISNHFQKPLHLTMQSVPLFVFLHFLYPLNAN